MSNGNAIGFMIGAALVAYGLWAASLTLLWSDYSRLSSAQPLLIQGPGTILRGLITGVGPVLLVLMAFGDCGGG